MSRRAGTPSERVGAMLLRQGRRKGAPGWALRLLAGETEAVEVGEEGDMRLLLTGQDGRMIEVEVRLHLPPPPAVAHRPWRPDGLALPAEKLTTLSYIVVDEIVGDAVDLSVSPWPHVDDRGRLAFGEEPARSVQASRAGLVRHLQKVEFRPGKPPDALRMGDVFAAVVRTSRLEAAERGRLSPSRWLVPPVYGIRRAARKKAKEAFYCAVAPTLSEAEARKLRKMKPRT